jgi:hypothetical protein
MRSGRFPAPRLTPDVPGKGSAKRAPGACAIPAPVRWSGVFAPQPNRPDLRLGRTLATPNALRSLPAEDIERALRRHASGDWGTLDEHDRRANNEALRFGARVLSVYVASNGTKFWIITEADRSATTVLLPEDY